MTDDDHERGGRHDDWTIRTYAAHNEALRAAEEKFQTERDRRYAEVRSAEEKALRVKEQADRDALALAREIQTYKDEKANELRAQIERERVTYATKADIAAVGDKIDNYVRELRNLITQNANTVGELRSRIDVGPPSLSTLQTRSDELVGRRGGALDSRTLAFAVIGALIGVIGITVAIVSLVAR